MKNEDTRNEVENFCFVDDNRIIHTYISERKCALVIENMGQREGEDICPTDNATRKEKLEISRDDREVSRASSSVTPQNNPLIWRVIHMN